MPPAASPSTKHSPAPPILKTHSSKIHNTNVSNSPNLKCPPNKNAPFRLDCPWERKIRDLIKLKILDSKGKLDTNKNYALSCNLST